MSDSPLLATGFGRVTRELTTRLAREPGIELACLAWGYEGWPYSREQLPFALYPSNVATNGQDNFGSVIDEFRPDIVITLGEIWALEWLHVHPARPRFKWVGYFPLDGGPFYPPWERVLKDVDELVAMSEFGRQVFRDGLRSRTVHVIPHGVNADVFRPLPERDRLKSHQRFDGKFVIGCVARNQSRKQIPALVQAAALLRQKIENIHLYLHMDPCDVGYDLVTLLHRYGLAGHADVSNPGFSVRNALEDAQLNRLYNLFDVTVLPSSGEGFGLPIIESMAAGVPVVATDCSACSELVRGRGELVRVSAKVIEGVNLLERAVIDVEDLVARLEKLYRQPQIVRQHSEAGLAFARGLTWQSLVPRWLELLQP